MTGVDPLLCTDMLLDNRMSSFAGRVSSKFRKSNIACKFSDDQSTNDSTDPYAFPGPSLLISSVGNGINLPASGYNTELVDSHLTSLEPSITIPALCSPLKMPRISESTSEICVNTLSSSPGSIAKLYPELAEKLERCKQKTIEINKGRGKNHSFQTMNQLQSKIAQNRIKDKLKRIKGQSTKQKSTHIIKPTSALRRTNLQADATGLPLPVYVSQKKRHCAHSITANKVSSAQSEIQPMCTDLIGLKPTVPTQLYTSTSEAGQKRDNVATTLKKTNIQRTKSSRAISGGTKQQYLLSRIASAKTPHSADLSITRHDSCVHRRIRNLHLHQAEKTLKTSSSLDYYNYYKQRKLLNHHLLNYDPVFCDEPNESGEEFPFQSTWFSPSSDDESINNDLQDDELTLHIRMTKLALLRDRLRRQSTEVHNAHRSNLHGHNLYLATAQCLVHAVRESFQSAHSAITLTQPDSMKSIRKIHRPKRDKPARRQCLHRNEKEVLCGSVALPYTNHCMRHILYNVDQQLFDYCTAKFADNTQCCVPVFDVKHELPLCAEHNRKAEYYAKRTTVDKRRPRKKTRPSALTRPPKKGKKKKNQRKKISEISHDFPGEITEHSEERRSYIGDTDPHYSLDNCLPDAAPANTSSISVDTSLSATSAASDKSFELTEAAMLADHELHDVLGKIREEDLDKLYSVKTSGFDMSNDEWERALAGVSASTMGRDDQEFLAKQIIASGLLENAEFISSLHDNDVIAGLSHENINALASGLENNLLDSTCITQASHDLQFSPRSKNFSHDSIHTLQENITKSTFHDDLDFSHTSKSFIQDRLPSAFLQETASSTFASENGNFPVNVKAFPQDGGKMCSDTPQTVMGCPPLKLELSKSYNEESLNNLYREDDLEDITVLDLPVTLAPVASSKSVAYSSSTTPATSTLTYASDLTMEQINAFMANYPVTASPTVSASSTSTITTFTNAHTALSCATLVSGRQSLSSVHTVSSAACTHRTHLSNVNALSTPSSTLGYTYAIVPGATQASHGKCTRTISVVTPISVSSTATPPPITGISLSAANPQLTKSLQRLTPQLAHIPAYVDPAKPLATSFCAPLASESSRDAPSVTISNCNNVCVINSHNKYIQSHLDMSDELCATIKYCVDAVKSVNKPSAVTSSVNVTIAGMSPHIKSTVSNSTPCPYVTSNISPHIKSNFILNNPISSTLVSITNVNTLLQSSILTNQINSVFAPNTAVCKNNSVGSTHSQISNPSISSQFKHDTLVSMPNVTDKTTSPHLTSAIVSSKHTIRGGRSYISQFNTSSMHTSCTTASHSVQPAYPTKTRMKSAKKKHEAVSQQIVSPILVQNISQAQNITFLSPNMGHTVSSIVLPVGYQHQQFYTNTPELKGHRGKSKVKSIVRAQTRITVPPTQTFLVTVPGTSSVTSSIKHLALPKPT